MNSLKYFEKLSVNYAAFGIHASPNGKTTFPAKSLIIIAAIMYQAANAQKLIHNLQLHSFLENQNGQ